MDFLSSLTVPQAALCVSVAAAAMSAKSMWNSSQALKLSRTQEARKSPFLKVYMAEGIRRLDGEAQVFGFRISVSNPTDTNNAIARAELQVNYILNSSTKITFRLQHDEKAFVQEMIDPIIAIPTKIDAHQTVAGWLTFVLDPARIGKGTVDSHDILLEDSHGITTAYPNISVQSWIDERTREDHTSEIPT